MKSVSINKNKCVEVAAKLASYDIKPSFYKRPFLSFDAARETKLRVYLMSAAICHQTHSLFHETLNLWGWEFMEYGFLKMVKERNALLNPSYMNICPEEEVSNILQRAFSFDGNPQNSTLDRIEERTNMLLELCTEIKTNYDGFVSKFLDQSEGKLIKNGKGYYEILEKFSAFSDPQKKKITFFLKLASDAGVIHIKDQENIIPIMDYHMQRVILRLGCLNINDKELNTKLLNRALLATDEPIRGACIEALKIIAEKSGKSILVMNDYFWPLGRSCCNETTLCFDKFCLKSPCTLDQIVEIKDHSKCMFEEVCLGSKDDEYRNLWEPVLETHFY